MGGQANHSKLKGCCGELLASRSEIFHEGIPVSMPDMETSDLQRGDVISMKEKSIGDEKD
jgi:hypothetical protein